MAIKKPFIPNHLNQVKFLNSKARECLFSGAKGNGKSLCLIWSFLMHCYPNKNYGEAWNGRLFRRTTAQLGGLTKMIIKELDTSFPPNCYKFNATKLEFTFRTGEFLKLTYIDDKAGYGNIWGNDISWIGFDELTLFENDEAYNLAHMQLRGCDENVPKMIRATTNPLGIGHSWVKKYYIDMCDGDKLTEIGEGEEKATRQVVYGRTEDNRNLMKGSPFYLHILKTTGSDIQRKAYSEGSWDLPLGGFFDGIWDYNRHIVEPFKIPRSWKVTRSLDWGTAKPYSVGWWAKSDGTPYTDSMGRQIQTQKGTVYRIKELYGGKDNVGEKITSSQLGRKILDIEHQLYNEHGIMVKSGVADKTIFIQSHTGNSIADILKDKGITFYKANMGHESRTTSLERMRVMLENALFDKPNGMFIFANCTDWIRTVPVIQTSERNPEDVDTEMEDHALDETRYYIMYDRAPIQTVDYYGHTKKKSSVSALYL